MIAQELTFWSLFFFFNASAFLVNTLLSYRHELWWPIKLLGKNDQRNAFIDTEGDFYKIFVELSLFILLARIYPLGGLIHGAIALYYAITLVYNAYHYAFSKIYQVLPVLGNDIRLMKNAAAILWAESKIKLIAFSLGFLMIVGLLSYGLFYYLQYSAQLGLNYSFYSISALFLVVLCLGVYKVGWYQNRFDNYSRILVMFLRVNANLKSTVKLRKRSAGWSNFKRKAIDLKLEKKPNIHFLFVESYGSVLLKEPQFKSDFLAHFEQKKSTLTQNGWHCLSNLSESISIVGPSWMAYTTVLMGMKIVNNFEYEYFLNHTSEHQLDTISSLFRKAGYEVVNINDSQWKKGINVPIKQMESLFGINHWILNKDVNFEGTEYGFGENSPDQYVLNFGLDHIRKKVGSPFFLFYLTKNSHTPFISPKTIVDDWKSLNNGKKELVGSEFLKKPTFEDYLSAIKYQWDMLEDLILKNGSEDDVFVLYGDHQPHDLGKLHKHGKETLVHIISKNPAFTQGFSAYGFKEKLSEMDQPIKHESFHTAFLREVIKNYGSADSTIPNYQPDGIQF